jgi:hypothetical protein
LGAFPLLASRLHVEEWFTIDDKKTEGRTMAERIVEHVHSEGGGGGALTVLAVVLFMLVLLAVLYFTGVFRRGPAKHEIDVNINKPGVVLQLPASLVR